MTDKKLKSEFKKRLYSFTLRLIEFIDKLPNDSVSKRIGDQLLRSGTSILGNYIEGQSVSMSVSTSSKKDFTNYFNTSLKSSNKSKPWLALLRDSRPTKSESVVWFLKELDELSNIFASSILTLNGRNGL